MLALLDKLWSVLYKSLIVFVFVFVSVSVKAILSKVCRYGYLPVNFSRLKNY